MLVLVFLQHRNFWWTAPANKRVLSLVNLNSSFPETLVSGLPLLVALDSLGCIQLVAGACDPVGAPRPVTVQSSWDDTAHEAACWLQLLEHTPGRHGIISVISTLPLGFHCRFHLSCLLLHSKTAAAQPGTAPATAYLHNPGARITN